MSTQKAFGKGRHNWKVIRWIFSLSHSKETKLPAGSYSFLLVKGETLDTCHGPVVSCVTLQCCKNMWFTKKSVDLCPSFSAKTPSSSHKATVTAASIPARDFLYSLFFEGSFQHLLPGVVTTICLFSAKTDGKHFLLEVGKMNECDFKTEISTIQLPRKDIYIIENTESRSTCKKLLQQGLELSCVFIKSKN